MVSSDRPQVSRHRAAISRSAWAVFAFVWLLAVLIGFWRLGSYANASGPDGTPPAEWPVQSAIARPTTADTVLVFAHPQCPCSRATISELARLMATSQGRLTAHVLMYHPSSQPLAWAQTDLWRSAAAIPGVDVSVDNDGAESARFGVHVSGHTLVYDRQGHLAFSGGITRSRGHEGDNAGRSAIAALAANRRMDTTRTRAFGCFLRPAGQS